MMSFIQRYLSIVFYLICLILAAGCFYFSISEGLFAWFAPDELAVSSTYHNAGLLGCINTYYLHTTINRISADLGICLMAKNAVLWGAPFMGWALSRLFFYALIPISMALVLKELVKIPFKFAVILALIISTIGLFILSDGIFYMFGLDLAIYATATITFFLLVALFPRSIENNLCYVLFCLVYSINLSSHEVFLPISGLFIPLFAWYHQAASDHKQTLALWVKNIWRDKKLGVLLVIYAASVLATIFAPGLAMRQHVWPSSGTYHDGLVYMALSVEEAAYFIYRSYILIFLIFLLGAICRFLVLGQPLPKKKLFYVFLFCVPLIYLLLMGYLLGITPSLWMGSQRTVGFQWIEPLIMTKSVLLKQGALAIRQNLFFYTGLLLDIFLAGFLLAGVLKVSLKREMNGLFQMILLLVVTMLFLFHPDGRGSAKILTALGRGDADIMHYSPQENKDTYPGNVMSYIFPGFPDTPVLTSTLLPRNHLANHIASVADILESNYLTLNQNEGVSAASLDAVYSRMIFWYQVTNPWKNQILSMYKVFIAGKCSSFLNPSEKIDLSCYNTVGNVLTKGRFTVAKTIHLNVLNGVEIKEGEGDCTQLRDISTRGEHFASSDLQLSKGLNYFIFDTQATNIELYIYIIGKNESVLFSWLNQSAKGWNKVSGDNSLNPVFSQMGTSAKSKKLALIIDSSVAQKIQLRWQHSSGGTSYAGNKENTSAICGAQFGQIVNANFV